MEVYTAWFVICKLIISGLNAPIEFVWEYFWLTQLKQNKKDGYRQQNVRQFLQSAYKAHYLATAGESRRYVVAFSRFAGGSTWLRQESLHFGLPWVRSGTIAVNVTSMERGFNARQTHRSIYPSILNRLRAIARYWLPQEIGNCNFFIPIAFNAPVGGVPIGIPGEILDLRKLESWGYQALKIV